MIKQLVLALLLFQPLLLAAAKESARQPAVGETPPPLLGKDREGKPIDLGDYRDKVVIVTFWASWCGPCRKELPVLAHFQKVVGHDALKVIAVNFKEPRSDFISVLRANRKLDLTYVHDAKGITSDEYGVSALPNMFIIDRSGKIAYVHRGYSEAMLEGIVEEILQLLPEEIRTRPASNAAANLDNRAATGRS